MVCSGLHSALRCLSTVTRTKVPESELYVVVTHNPGRSGWFSYAQFSVSEGGMLSANYLLAGTCATRRSRGRVWNRTLVFRC